MNALSLNSLLTYIQSLPLTKSNKEWLACHLVEPANSSTDEERMKNLEKNFGLWASDEEEYSTEQFIEELNSMCAGNKKGRISKYEIL